MLPPLAKSHGLMRKVIVTGASRGLGLAIARRLSGEGYCAIAIARQKGEELASAIASAEKTSPNSLHFVSFDLAETQCIPALVKQLRKDFGPIYGLVNNAAVGFNGILGMMLNSQIESLIRINTLAPILLTKYLVRHMMADGAGRVINVASISAFSGYSGLSVYAATKASMIGFTHSLAREVGRVGITVNAVAPGFMNTELTQSLGEEHRRQIARRSAMQRLADVEDAVDAVEFLLSSKAKSITGTVLTVDAGATA
jgi:3-oxoacyl-[acyl-carrier protein] reductase